MVAATAPSTPSAGRQLLPAGKRWGEGAESVRAYLTEAWATKPSNPVFTPEHVAAIVWPGAAPSNRPEKLHA